MVKTVRFTANIIQKPIKNYMHNRQKAINYWELILKYAHKNVVKEY